MIAYFQSGSLVKIMKWFGRLALWIDQRPGSGRFPHGSGRDLGHVADSNVLQQFPENQDSWSACMVEGCVSVVSLASSYLLFSSLSCSPCLCVFFFRVAKSQFGSSFVSTMKHFDIRYNCSHSSKAQVPENRANPGSSWRQDLDACSPDKHPGHYVRTS